MVVAIHPESSHLLSVKLQFVLIFPKIEVEWQFFLKRGASEDEISFHFAAGLIFTRFQHTTERRGGVEQIQVAVTVGNGQWRADDFTNFIPREQKRSAIDRVGVRTNGRLQRRNELRPFKLRKVLFFSYLLQQRLFRDRFLHGRFLGRAPASDKQECHQNDTNVCVFHIVSLL